MSVVHLNRATFALPVERFRFDALESLEERLPIVTEFVLRLAHIVGSATADVLREFFGFSDEEALSVLESMQQQGLLVLSGDHVELSSFALARFQESGTDYPLFSKVERREDVLDVDLFTFSPLLPKVAARSVTDNDIRLEPLPQDVSRSSDRARQSYREHFPQIAQADKRRTSREKFYGLYSVKDMESRGRFFTPVEMLWSLDSNGEILKEARSPHWKDDQGTLEARVNEEISERLSRIPRAEFNLDAFQDFVSIFGDPVLGRFLAGGEFDLQAYLGEVFVSRTARYPRGVEPMAGAVYLDHNAARLKDRIVELRRADRRNGALLAPMIWLRPAYELWGRGEALASTLNEVNALLNPTGDEVHFLLQTESRLSQSELAVYRAPGVKQLHFVNVDGSLSLGVGDCMEVCLYPMGFVIAQFHVPIPGSPHVRAPVGFYSTLPSHLDAAHQLLRSLVAGRRYGGSARWTSNQKDESAPWQDALTALNL